MKEQAVEVKIGIQSATREIVIDSELTADQIHEAVSKALDGDTGLLSLHDAKGRRVLVPTDKLAYVEVGAPTVGQVGFRS